MRLPGETPSTESRPNEDRRTEGERISLLFPTHEVAKAYLKSLGVSMWGQSYYPLEPGSLDKAAELLTHATDAINAIRNIALEHGVGLDQAAMQYRQLTRQTITKKIARD